MATLYRTGNRTAVKWQPWHIINPETLLAFCGDDPGDCGEHFHGIDGELPAGDRFCEDCVHAKNGYKVVNVRYGQVRRYGPTVNRWHVTDLTHKRTVEEVKAYCLEHIRQVPERGDPKFHPLDEHYQGMVHLGCHVYEFQTGHEWTG